MGLLNAIEARGGITEVLVACSCLLDRKKWQCQQQNVIAYFLDKNSIDSSFLMHCSVPLWW